jgi:phosphotransferase system  glucose/maltose/N-acetylglucosamine-specific IIC component
MEKSKSKTNLIVLFVCFISIIFSLPIWLLSHMSLDNILKNGNCTIYNANFKIYGSIFSFIIPLGIMMVMYWLTVKRLKIVLNEFKLKCQKNNMRLSFDCKTELENKLTKKLNIKITGKTKTDNFEKQKVNITSEKSSNNLLLNPIVNNLKAEQTLKINLSNTSLSRISTFKNIAKESFKISKIKQNENKEELKTDEKYLAEPPVKKLRFKTIVNKHLLARQAINAFKLSRESSVVKNQQKAVKVLGVVLVIF